MVFTVTAQTTVNIDFDTMVTAADRMAGYLSYRTRRRGRSCSALYNLTDTDPGMDSLAGMIDNPAGMGELSDLFGVIGISTQEQKDALPVCDSVCKVYSGRGAQGQLCNACKQDRVFGRDERRGRGCF